MAPWDPTFLDFWASFFRPQNHKKTCFFDSLFSTFWGTPRRVFAAPAIVFSRFPLSQKSPFFSHFGSPKICPGPAKNLTFGPTVFNNCFTFFLLLFFEKVKSNAQVHDLCEVSFFNVFCFFMICHDFPPSFFVLFFSPPWDHFCPFSPPPSPSNSAPALQKRASRLSKTPLFEKLTFFMKKTPSQKITKNVSKWPPKSHQKHWNKLNPFGAIYDYFWFIRIVILHLIILLIPYNPDLIIMYFQFKYRF